MGTAPSSGGHGQGVDGELLARLHTHLSNPSEPRLLVDQSIGIGRCVFERPFAGRRLQTFVWGRRRGKRRGHGT